MGSAGQRIPEDPGNLDTPQPASTVGNADRVNGG